MGATRTDNENAEFDKYVAVTVGGRKHRNSERKRKKDTRYFVGRNQPPKIECPHTVLHNKGNNKCMSKSLSAGDVERMYFACYFSNLSIYYCCISF